MFIEIFSLCDAATGENGKLNILGAFDTIWVRQFPTVYPHCAVAIRIRFSVAEKGDHQLGLRLIDADGKDVLPPAGGAMRLDLPEGQTSGSTNLILNIQSLKLEKTGECSLALAIDGQNVLSLPLFVREMANPR
jgi:hypothetical protein